MSLILTIDTASEQAGISLSKDGKALVIVHNNEQKNHATWIHSAIDDLMTQAGKSLSSVEAVGLTIGPGSYTGLRVGMATAKGLCYALKIPLVGVNTLLALASSFNEQECDYLCPMMDAGRMEVYTALYTKELREVVSPKPMILNEQSFSEELSQSTICFFGSGKNKFQPLVHHPNSRFADYEFEIADLSPLIHSKFLASEFSSLAYLEPLYLKEFASHVI